MNNFLFFLFVFLCRLNPASAQDALVSDLDGDKTKDTVLLNREQSIIVCRLSTQNFKRLQSRKIDVLNEQAGLAAAKNGFEFYNNWMRAGYRNQFRYDVKTKRVQLIGMSRSEAGNAANDGSGESSVNLLTNDYLGRWKYFDEAAQKLIDLPAIKTKMALKKTYLEDFSDATYFSFAEQCSALFEKEKAKALKKKK